MSGGGWRGETIPDEGSGPGEGGPAGEGDKMPDGEAGLEAELASMGQANGTTVKRRSTYHGGQIGRKATLNYANTEFTTNYIRTGKYTIWTFLPKSLFEQFRSVPPRPREALRRSPPRTAPRRGD